MAKKKTVKAKTEAPKTEAPKTEAPSKPMPKAMYYPEGKEPQQKKQTIAEYLRDLYATEGEPGICKYTFTEMIDMLEANFPGFNRRGHEYYPSWYKAEAKRKPHLMGGRTVYETKKVVKEGKKASKPRQTKAEKEASNNHFVDNHVPVVEVPEDPSLPTPTKSKTRRSSFASALKASAKKTKKSRK